MQRKVNRLIRLATSFVILGLVPLLAAGTVLTGHFRSNMERVVLDDIGRMVSYEGSNTEAVLEECSSLTKHIYDVSTDDGMFLYQITNPPVLAGRKENEITLLLVIFWTGTIGCSVYFKGPERSRFIMLPGTRIRYWMRTRSGIGPGKRMRKGIFRSCPPIWMIIFRIPGSGHYLPAQLSGYHLLKDHRKLSGPFYMDMDVKQAAVRAFR